MDRNQDFEIEPKYRALDRLASQLQSESVEIVTLQIPAPIGLYKELEGTIDLHIHTVPDGFPRLMTDLEVAAQAKAVRMKAIVLKCHVSSTPDRAFIAQRAMGGGLEIYGIICLNTPVGGMNPDAVRMAIRMGAKAVWMPSMWAENHARYVRDSARHMGYETIGMDFPQQGETILTADHQIKSEVVEILKLVAENDLMLSTGHLSLPEAHLLVEEATKVGIRKLLVHTVNYHVLHYPLDDLKRMADRGAFLEFGFSSLPYPIWEPADPNRRISLDDVCTTIRSVGVEKCVVSSDSGQVSTPIPIECLRLWIEFLKIKGFGVQEIDLMTKTNPAKLLGIE